MLRREVTSRPLPVSLLDTLSYVSEYQLLVQNEGIRRVYVGYLTTLSTTRFTGRQ